MKKIPVKALLPVIMAPVLIPGIVKAQCPPRVMVVNVPECSEPLAIQTPAIVVSTRMPQGTDPLAPAVVLVATTTRIEVAGPPPILGACGTGASIVGSEAVGKIAVGTSAGSTCAMTFRTPWTFPPICHAVDRVDNEAIGVPTSVKSATFTVFGISGMSIGYICQGYK